MMMIAMINFINDGCGYGVIGVHVYDGESFTDLFHNCVVLVDDDGL